MLPAAYDAISAFNKGDASKYKSTRTQPATADKCLTICDTEPGSPSRGRGEEIEATEDEVPATRTGSALPAGAPPARRLHAAPGGRGGPGRDS